jgi:hypothetical protein
MRCNACSAENREGRRFCSQCGAPLRLSCPARGEANEPGNRFCGACGGDLAKRPQRVAAPVGERRMVSILFADLVGFTPLTEARDPEQARELLSRYFALASTVVARHGGTVENDLNLDSELLARVHLACLEDGVYFAPRGMLNTSTAMDEAVIEEAVTRFARTVGRVASTAYAAR